MMKLKHPTWVALMAALMLSIAACGGGDDNSGSASDPGSEGTKVSGTGYEITAPKGWTRAPNSVGEETHLIATRGKQQVAAVTLSRLDDPPAGVPLQQLGEAIRTRLVSNVPGLTAADISSPQPMSLGGTDALTYTANAHVPGKDANILGVVTLRDDVEYTIIYGAPAGEDKQQLADFKAMLKSWKWKDAKSVEKRLNSGKSGLDSTSDAPSLSGEAKAAVGDPIPGTGYVFKLPRGWRSVPVNTPEGLKQPEGYKPPENIVTGGTFHGGGVTMSVTVDEDGGDDLDAYLEEKGQLYFDPGSTLKDISLAGATAKTGQRKTAGLDEGTTLQIQQIVALHDGKAYIVGFMSPSDHFDEKFAGFQSALASWRWL